MSVEPRFPHIPGDDGAARGRAADALAQSEAAQERADLEEDRRRQGELDYAELGGEG